MYLIINIQEVYTSLTNRLNPYSNGTMYLMSNEMYLRTNAADVLILILMEQCI